MKKLLLLLTLLAPSVQAEPVRKVTVLSLDTESAEAMCEVNQKMAELVMGRRVIHNADFKSTFTMQHTSPLWTSLTHEAYHVTKIKHSPEEEVKLFGLEQKRACIEYYHALRTGKWEVREFR